MNLINWEELKQIIKYKEYFKFKRSLFNSNRYLVHKFLLKKENIKLHNYITNKYLKNKKYSLVKNDFPYNLEKNILHLVLWINDGEIIDIEEVIKKELKNNYEFLYFENPVNLRSVLEIKHLQVFIKLH